MGRQQCIVRLWTLSRTLYSLSYSWTCKKTWQFWNGGSTGLLKGEPGSTVILTFRRIEAGYSAAKHRCYPNNVITDFKVVVSLSLLDKKCTERACASLVVLILMLCGGKIIHAWSLRRWFWREQGEKILHVHPSCSTLNPSPTTRTTTKDKARKRKRLTIRKYHIPLAKISTNPFKHVVWNTNLTQNIWECSSPRPRLFRKHACICLMIRKYRLTPIPATRSTPPLPHVLNARQLLPTAKRSTGEMLLSEV